MKTAIRWYAPRLGLILAPLLLILSGCIVVNSSDNRPGTVAGSGSHADTPLVYSTFNTATGRHQVHWINLDGGHERALTDGWNPHVSPDGSALAFQRDGDYPAGKDDHLYVLDFATNGETKVMDGTDYLVGSSWTNDSQALVFDELCSLGRVNRDGSGAISLRDKHCYDDSPSVNPVSGRIAFHNAAADAGGLWTMNADGGEAARIPGSSLGDAWPAWSPDGQWISFLRTNGQDLDKGVLYRVRPNGGDLGPLLEMTLDANTYVRPTAGWTRDGRGVVAAMVNQGQASVRLVATDGSGNSSLIPVPVPEQVDFVGNTLDASSR